MLLYDVPAEKWVQALPVGNGRLGAMVFGQPRSERLQLNDVTIWSHGPNPDADRKDAYESLPELRRLIREGEYAEAERFANNCFNGPAPYDASYQTLGDLNFEFNLPTEDIVGYQRYLDIEEAIAGVRFTCGGVGYFREIFSSAPDQALVQRFSADRPGMIGFTMRLSRVERATTRFVSPDTLVMTGDTGPSLSYEVHAKVLQKGGKITEMPDGQLRVEGANEAVVILAAATSFVLDYDAGYRGGDMTVAAKNLQSAAAKPYEGMRREHVVDYRRYFDRVKLDLGPADTKTPTETRLKSYAQKHDPSFAALFYQYGRYLLNCSSRPENPLPSNAQGIWGDGLDLPWKCDYKANINYQMNYWAAEPSNLGEMHLPMIRMTQNLVTPGSKTAKSYFGPQTPGWVCGYTTNGWSWTSPGERLVWGIWWGGSAWMCQHLWEHYAFTRDTKYLKSVYSTMKGAAEFWHANLIEGPDGSLIVSPSSSPENEFTTDAGVSSSITEGGGMDNALVWELLDNTINAARVLKIDNAFVQKLVSTRDRVRPPQIGKGGYLMEWNGDWDMNSKDLHHRHLSHVYPFHPGHQITLTDTPELAAAVKKTLEIRGDDGTGWSLSWKINCWARLHDGDHALRLMDLQFRHSEESSIVMRNGGGTYTNLFDAHPPFQIDGNFGFVSGVNEMLLQSHQRYTDAESPNQDRYYIDLLPALPAEWENGSVSGLRARGGFEVSMRWLDGRLIHASLTNVTDGIARGKVRLGPQVLQLSLQSGQSRTLNGSFD